MTLLKKPYFERLYKTYNHQEHLDKDPLGYLPKSHTPEDFEILSFIIAGITYGRREQIQKSILNLYSALQTLGLGLEGQGIATLLKNHTKGGFDALFLKGFKHRLNTRKDMIECLEMLSAVLKAEGSLCRLFQRTFHEDSQTHFENFCTALFEYSGSTRKPNKRNGKWLGTGVTWFVPNPSAGSTSKRMLMWLRWVIRKDNVDYGVWSDSTHGLADSKLPLPHPSRLFYAVDTHIFQWAKSYKITSSASPTWKSTLEITQYFRKICPEDPVRYDFALCHLGMEEFRS